MTSLRAVRWVNGKMIAVKDGSFLEEEDGKIKVTALKDAQEIKQKLTECFPEVDRSTIDAAIEHWVHHIQKCGHAGHGWEFYSGHLMSPQTTPKRKVGEKLDHWTCGSEGSQLQNQQQISFRTPQKMDDTTSSMLNFQLMCCNSADVLLPSGFGLSP